MIKDLSTVWALEESPGGSPFWIRGYGGHQLLRYYRVRKIGIDVFGACCVLVQWRKDVFKAEKGSHGSEHPRGHPRNPTFTSNTAANATLGSSHANLVVDDSEFVDLSDDGDKF